MIRAFIPRYRQVEGDGGRTHYAYIVEVCYTGRVHKLEKRYSAFHSLYKELRKVYATTDFPPKLLRNTTTKALESRRAGLEQWLHSALLLQPCPQALLTFLLVHNYQPPIEQCEEDISPAHQPILVYPRDPYLAPHICCPTPHICSTPHSCPGTPHSHPHLPSSITKGVLTALYDQNFCMPA